MKIKITQKGVHDGKGNRVEIGTVIDLGDTDTLPPVFLNKATIIGEVAEGAEPVTNEDDTEKAATEKAATEKAAAEKAAAEKAKK